MTYTWIFIYIDSDITKLLQPASGCHQSNQIFFLMSFLGFEASWKNPLQIWTLLAGKAGTIDASDASEKIFQRGDGFHRESERLEISNVCCMDT